MFFRLVKELLFLFRARAGRAGDHIKQSCQKEPQEESSEKQFWRAVYEQEEKQSEGENEKRLVLTERKKPWQLAAGSTTKN